MEVSRGRKLLCGRCRAKLREALLQVRMSPSLPPPSPPEERGTRSCKQFHRMTANRREIGSTASGCPIYCTFMHDTCSPLQVFITDATTTLVPFSLCLFLRCPPPGAHETSACLKDADQAWGCTLPGQRNCCKCKRVQPLGQYQTFAFLSLRSSGSRSRVNELVVLMTTVTRTVGLSARNPSLRAWSPKVGFGGERRRSSRWKLLLLVRRKEGRARWSNAIYYEGGNSFTAPGPTPPRCRDHNRASWLSRECCSTRQHPPG